uniref:EF-hand domain-containing protein n=1 Tax=Oryzias sinensis TaxID=183150 RepID=A0A8C7XRX9_9TELE
MGQAESAAGKEVTLQHIQELYRRFASECPSGNLHFHEFRRIFGVSSSSTQESAYMKVVFQSFDTNKDGKIDFMEYVAAVNLILRGKLEDKLKWSFKVYDRDGNGSLSREEVGHVVHVSISTDTQICYSSRKLPRIMNLNVFSFVIPSPDFSSGEQTPPFTNVFFIHLTPLMSFSGIS